MNYIGNKQKFVPFIKYVIDKENIKGNVFCDLFAGTASVGKYFKSIGYSIISNDFLFFSYALQKTYIQQNDYPDFLNLSNSLSLPKSTPNLFNVNSTADNVISYLNNINEVEGFFYHNYSPQGTLNQPFKRMYFTDYNAKKIDAIRTKIQSWLNSNLISEQEFFFLLTSLIEATSSVVNSCGNCSAFLKNFEPKALKPIKLSTPTIVKSNIPHQVFNQDAMSLLPSLQPFDILYIDPPYNERQYAPNYHIYETLAKYDSPTISGLTGIRDYQNQKSTFCSQDSALSSLISIASNSNFNCLLMSYSEDGIIPVNQIIHTLNSFGSCSVFNIPYKRYRSNNKSKLSLSFKEMLFCLKKNH